MFDDDDFEFGIPDDMREWFNSKFPGYILENGKIKKADLATLSAFYANPDARRVDQTEIRSGKRAVKVSTVFLGIDHNYVQFWEGGDKRPILFETMIFGGHYDGYMWRYRTFGEAKKGHWDVVEALRSNNTGFFQ